MNENSLTPYIGKTDLKTLLGILKNVDVLVTGDTGPLHLAVALKTRTISLFVTANPSHTGPYQDPELHQILQVPYEAAKQNSTSLEQPLSVIGADEVLEKITSLLSKNQ
jgi:ADP-heptose:LPS heptosyltransferase